MSILRTVVAQVIADAYGADPIPGPDESEYVRGMVEMGLAITGHVDDQGQRVEADMAAELLVTTARRLAALGHAEPTRQVWVVTFEPIAPHSLGGVNWFSVRADAESAFHALTRNRWVDRPTHRVRMWDAYPIAAWDNDTVTRYVVDTFVNDDPPGSPIWDNES